MAWALLPAVFVKVGLQQIDAHFATLVRSAFVLVAVLSLVFLH